MRYDLAGLDHQKQHEFLESLKDGPWIDNNYYRVFYDKLTNEFLLLRVDYVVKNKTVIREEI